MVQKGDENFTMLECTFDCDLDFSLLILTFLTKSKVIHIHFYLLSRPNFDANGEWGGGLIYVKISRGVTVHGQ